jgi:hypothetical protein
VNVTADSVPKCLSSLRARLEPDDCIQTVYKRGYRLSAEVRPDIAAEAGILPRLAVLPLPRALRFRSTLARLLPRRPWSGSPACILRSPPCWPGIRCSNWPAADSRRSKWAKT